MGMKELALSITDLEYSYRSDWLQKQVRALKGVSVDVFAGEAFGFLGHNGAGKTTTIKCIIGLVRPSAGSISIFGIPARDLNSRQLVGYVPEQPYFYDYLTVQETMELYGRLRGVAKEQLGREVSDALARLKMTDRKHSKIRSLSKGLMQRVAMAQAILGNPKLLILDEPFSGLDPIGRKEFRDLIFELKSEGKTIFMSSHILSDVEFICDRASIMVQGELKGIYNLKEISSRADGGFELCIGYVGEAQRAKLAKIAELATNSIYSENRAQFNIADRVAAQTALSVALEHQLQIDSFAPLQSSLEATFMKLVEENKVRSDG